MKFANTDSQAIAESLHRILLVEDDIGLSDVVKEYLEKNGMEVHTEFRGDTAVDHIIQLNPDLVILDLMLPGLDGIEVCRSVRTQYSGPILMLTARDEDLEQVVGLEVGADDYVSKPVMPRVLLARIRALLRRIPQANVTLPKQGNLRFGQLEISLSNRTVSLAGAIIEMTTIEFDLLKLLASNAGKVLTRDEIYQSLSGMEYDGLDRAVDIRISRLRKLIQDNPSSPKRIKTVRGKGYLFATDTWD